MTKFNVGDQVFFNDFEAYQDWYKQETGFLTVAENVPMVIEELDGDEVCLGEDVEPNFFHTGFLPARFISKSNEA